MTLKQLRSFVHAVEAGSFTKAAKLQGLNQASVSDQIKLLEDHVGCRLFKRHTDFSGVSLTNAGEKLLPRAKAILAAVGAACSSMLSDSSS